MPNYQLSKIYKIVSSHTDLCYIGSTAQKYLSTRLAEHKKNYRRFLNKKYPYTTSFDIVKYDDTRIELIEAYPCNMVEELRRREGEIIQEYEGKRCNKLIAGGKDKKRKDYYQSDYQHSKIYKIVSSHTDLCYIGSTAYKHLSMRFRDHKRNYKQFLNKKTCYVSSYEIVKYDDARIELIELYPCNTVEELRRREGEIILEYEGKCCNKIIAGRTHKERYEENKERLAQQQKEYREENKEKLAQKGKDYREKNKEKIAQQKSEQNICDCGGKWTRGHGFKRHEKTKKHQSFINN